MSWYVHTISAKDIPLWRWPEIDVGDWAVITAVRAAFDAGLEESREEARQDQRNRRGQR